MKQTGVCWVLALVAPFALPIAAAIPDEFTNLTVLPKDIGKRELVGMMRGFSLALGVRCEHCHVEKGSGPTHEEDFASDDLEPKRVARGMMKMVQEINAGLQTATGRKAPIPVRCATCHRGVVRPEGLDQILMTVVEEKGVPAAVERYAALRKEYFGTGSYDFSPRSLNEIVEHVAEGKDVEGAITLVKLNLEHDPNVVQSHLLLGQLLAKKGDKAGAIASLERALALEPENRRVEQALAKVRAAE